MKHLVPRNTAIKRGEACWRSLFLGSLLVVAGSRWAGADTILLKSGKEIVGKILKEDNDEFTIRSGPTIYLKISKDDIAHVERTRAPVSNRPVVRTPAVVSTATAAVVAAVETPVMSLKNVALVPWKTSQTRGEFQCDVNVVYSSYGVTGADWKNVQASLFDLKKGAGFLNGFRREATRVVWASTWSATSHGGPGGYHWQKGLITTAITVHVPVWDAPPTVSSAAVQSWNHYVVDMESDIQARVGIVQRGIESLGDEFSGLLVDQAAALKSESDRLYAHGWERIDNRLKGHERRLRQKKKAA